jgi:hypothetical protein
MTTYYRVVYSLPGENYIIEDLLVCQEVRCHEHMDKGSKRQNLESIERYFMVECWWLSVEIESLQPLYKIRYHKAHQTDWIQNWQSSSIHHAHKNSI